MAECTFFSDLELELGWTLLKRCGARHLTNELHRPATHGSTSISVPRLRGGVRKSLQRMHTFRKSFEQALLRELQSTKQQILFDEELKRATNDTGHRHPASRHRGTV